MDSGWFSKIYFWNCDEFYSSKTLKTSIEFEYMKKKQISIIFQHYSSYSIIGLLLDHIERHFQSNKDYSIKTGIMYVVHDCLVFSAKTGAAGKLSPPSRLFLLLSPMFIIDFRFDDVRWNSTFSQIIEKIIWNRTTIESSSRRTISSCCDYEYRSVKWFFLLIISIRLVNDCRRFYGEISWCSNDRSDSIYYRIVTDTK